MEQKALTCEINSVLILLLQSKERSELLPLHVTVHTHQFLLY